MFDIGFTYRSEYLQSITDNKEAIDFLEIIPDGINISDNSPKSNQLKPVIESTKFTAHSIDLSIASQYNEDFELRFDEIFKFLKDTNIKHYSDHLSYTRCRAINCDAYVPPLYGFQSPDTISRRCAYIKNKLSALNCDFALENVANTVLADPLHPELEGNFMKNISSSTGISFILNIDSLLISSAALGVTPLELLATYPVDAIEAVTIVPPDAMNVVMNEQYGVLVEQEALKVFEESLELISPRRIVLQVRYQYNTLDKQLPYIENLKTIREKYSKANLKSPVNLMELAHGSH